jgi:hypothetical protein
MEKKRYSTKNSMVGFEGRETSCIQEVGPRLRCGMKWLVVIKEWLNKYLVK